MLWDLIEKSNRLCSLSPRSEPYPKNQKQLVLVLCPWWSCCRIWSSFIHGVNETVFRVKTNFGFNPACVNKLTRFRQRNSASVKSLARIRRLVRQCELTFESQFMVMSHCNQVWRFLQFAVLGVFMVCQCCERS